MYSVTFNKKRLVSKLADFKTGQAFTTASFELHIIYLLLKHYMKLDVIIL